MNNSLLLCTRKFRFVLFVFNTMKISKSKLKLVAQVAQCTALRVDIEHDKSVTYNPR